MNDELIPIPFMLGSMGAIAVRFQHISQYMSDVEGSGAVVLGLILLLYTSYMIYRDWLCLKRKGKYLGKINRLILFYIACLLLIFVGPFIGPKNIAVLVTFIGIICPTIVGFYFYKEKFNLM